MLTIITLVASSHLFIEHHTHPSLTTLHHYQAHNSSIMTIISVWEGKKEKKKKEEEAMVGVSLMTTTMTATTM